MRSLLVFLCLGIPSFAASPTVGLVLPRGGQRGTDVTLSFQGTNLADTQEVIVYFPGISIRKIESVTATEVKATALIAPDCRLGEHAFRLRTATGISDLRTFWVGALPSIDEKENNNDVLNSQAIPLNVTVQGLITNEDVDYFAVDCKKGQRLSVEIEGMRLGTIFFDPSVTIYNDKNFELAVADDSYITGQDGGAAILVPADGKYIIQVRDSAYAGNARSYYRLHVGNFPRPTAVVPSGGKPGESVEFRFLGDPLGEIKTTVKLPDANLNLARVHAQTPEGIHPAGIKVCISELTPVAEMANANSLKTAITGTAPCAFHGVLGVPGEIDHLKFFAKKGQVFQVECFGRRLGSAIDPVIEVFLMAKDGSKLTDRMGVNDDTGGPDAQLRFTAAEEGEHCIRIRDHLGQGGLAYFYRVEVHPPLASAGVRLPRADGNNAANQDRQTWSVPKGSRLAVPLVLRRADWGGVAKLMLENLPPGVSATIEPIDFASPIIPVILEAKADSVLGAKLALPRLVPVAGEIRTMERSTVDVVLSQGGNNTNFHSLATDHIAVAVTEAAPFSIDVIEPKVPLVQNGSMQLRVMAKRDGVFKGPITVLPVMTPPGVGIVGSTVIPENANECLININAAANSAPRKWRLAFMAFANTGNGNIWVGSNLFTLEVAPPLVAFTQPRTVIEQGQSAQVICKVSVGTPFTGKARAVMVGLPPKVTAAPVEFESSQTEVAFTVTTDKSSPAGKHNTFCQVVIVKDGENILHNVGGGELRIDAPVAVKGTAIPPKPATTPLKPLSRLEQLRKEQEEKGKADKGKKDQP